VFLLVCEEASKVPRTKCTGAPPLPCKLPGSLHPVCLCPRTLVSSPTWPYCHPTSACRRTLGAHCYYCNLNRTPCLALRCPLTATSARPAYCASSAHSTRLAGVQGPVLTRAPRPIISSLLCLSLPFPHTLFPPVALRRSSAGHYYYTIRPNRQYIFGTATAPRPAARRPRTAIAPNIHTPRWAIPLLAPRTPPSLRS
jgi:hypothetical protein